MTTPQEILDYYLLNTVFASSRDIHRVLGIRQPWCLWIARHIQYAEPLNDYLRQRGDIYLSPTYALNVAAGGGSPMAAKVQSLYCNLLSEIVFKDRCPIEVMDTAMKVTQAEKFLARELDPERGA